MSKLEQLEKWIDENKDKMSNHSDLVLYYKLMAKITELKAEEYGKWINKDELIKKIDSRFEQESWL